MPAVASVDRGPMVVRLREGAATVKFKGYCVVSVLQRRGGGSGRKTDIFREDQREVSYCDVEIVPGLSPITRVWGA